MNKIFFLLLSLFFLLCLPNFGSWINKVHLILEGFLVQVTKRNGNTVI